MGLGLGIVARAATIELKLVEIEEPPPEHLYMSGKTPCPECAKPFATASALTRHRAEKHGS